ncbi:MAG: ComEC/Rec2 family competence protein [candidate division Zixibacteria bacterium]|nr:ComEC/Rec2 family competence protein [candidate division Zixibacteria bacterium]
MLRTYPSLFLLSMIVPGIVLADQIQLPVWALLLISAFVALIGIIWLRKTKLTRATLALGFALLFFSAFHYSLCYYPTGQNHIANYADGEQRYHIYGQIIDWPKLRAERTEFKVSIDSLISSNAHHVHGAVLLKLHDTTTSLQRGDRLEFYGRIYPLRNTATPGGFDYRRYLNLKGVHGIVYLSTQLNVRLDKRNRYGLINLVDKLRSAIVDSFNRNMSPVSAALAAGFLIGETRNIPTEIYSWFRDSGTLHLLAVSGSNVAIVLGFFIFLMWPMPLTRRLRTAILIVVIILFTLISYGDPSVVRASIMAILVLLSRLIQRRIDLNNIIGATAVAILLYDPTQLFDVGFQLSFTTAWGLIFITPVIVKRFEAVKHRRWFLWIILPVVVSIIAQICSGPLIAFYFHRIPVLSVPANILIVMLTSGAVFGILGILLADAVLPLLGIFTGSLVNWFMELILHCLRFFGGEGAPIIEVSSIPVWFVLACYVYIVLLVFAVHSLRKRRIVVLSLAVLVNLVLLNLAVNSFATEDHTDMWLVTVPGGIAAVVQQNGQPNGDLIITGLNARDYPIDDRILVPMLEGMGIEDINSIFIISSDYGAIDDIVRTADRMAADRLIIANQLEHSVNDVVRFSQYQLKATEIIVTSDISTEHRAVGYYPFRNGVLFQYRDSSVLFVDEFVPDRISEFSKEKLARLVIGRGIDKNEELTDWAVEYGVSSIVARSIFGSGSNELLSDSLSSQKDLIDITDLRQVGALHIRFSP